MLIGYNEYRFDVMGRRLYYDNMNVIDSKVQGHIPVTYV